MMTVTQADMDRAAKASGFTSWEDALYWSNLAKQSAVSDLANEFAKHREAAIKEARELLTDLANQQDAYCKICRLVGPYHRDTDRAWDLLRRAGDAARAFLISAKGQGDG